MESLGPFEAKTPPKTQGEHERLGMSQERDILQSLSMKM